ncbi:hypothetical protein ABQE58_25125 [Mycolicibacterium elephantis]
MAEQKFGVGSAIVLLLAVGWLGAQCSKDDSMPDAKRDATTTTTKAPYPHQVMAGDGYHNMGGIDGKDWGIWQSSGGPECTWSIRLTSPYTGATILREGTAPPNQSPRVSIQPPGDVSSITGEIDGGRVIFQTHGCGSWRLAR